MYVPPIRVPADAVAVIVVPPSRRFKLASPTITVNEPEAPLAILTGATAKLPEAKVALQAGFSEIKL